MITDRSSKAELIRNFSRLTLHTIVSTNSPSIGSLERTYGEPVVRNAMGVIISDLSASFRGDLEPSEIEEIIEEVRSGLFRNITLEGLYMVCRQIKTGKVHGKLNVNKVLQCVQEHLNEQCMVYQTINHNEHLSTKHNEPRINNEREQHAKALNFYLTNKKKQ